MTKGFKIDMSMRGLDGLFSTQEQRDVENLEKIREVPLTEIDEFPGHPFKVRDDESMTELVASIAANGIQAPIIVWQNEVGRYETVSGHRRKRACEIAGMKTIPSIVRIMSRDEAIVYMVEANLQREKILPSEKAFAYKMKQDALKRQGKRSDLTSLPLASKLAGKETAAIIGDSMGESKDQVYRYIRLTGLIPPILEEVDNNSVAFRPAVELSYLSNDMQEAFFDIMQQEDCTPSLAQAQKMKRLDQEGKLTEEVMFSIMAQEKPNQVEQFKIPKKFIDRFFSPGTRKEVIQDAIVKALDSYMRERDQSGGC